MVAFADLKAQLAQSHGAHVPCPKQRLDSFSESQLAAMQQQHTADMVQAISEYVRHHVQRSAGHSALQGADADSLAAMQRQQTVKLINEVTQYLQKDTNKMQQIANLYKTQLSSCR